MAKTDYSALRQAMGIGDDVSDKGLAELLKTAAGRKDIKHIESQPKGGDQGWSGFLQSHVTGPLSTVGHVAQDIYNSPATRIPEGIATLGMSEIPHAIENAVAGSGSAPAAKKKKVDTTPLPDPAKAAASVPESPYQQLAQALASEYLGQVQQLMPLTSGSGIFGPQGQTNQTVNAAANMVPGGGAWLQQQAAAEQQAAQPLQAAMGQVGEAQAQNAIPYAGAIANTGTANTQYLAAAPWQQILSELASETAYKAAQGEGAAAFGATAQNTPSFLNQIFKNLGLGGVGTTSVGLASPTTAAKGGTGSSPSGTSPSSPSSG